ncbi:MAG: hypothetical protein QOJ59_151 [Thermomicrobiales bacterium]|nr:hypothetical protein [Thermomicrobiales bacterium]
MTGDSRREPQDDRADDSDRGDDRQAPQARSAAEWTTLLGSLIVVAVLIGAAFYEHFGRDEPAGTWLAVELAPERSAKRGDQFYIPFVVTNQGTNPAEDVAVVFEVKDGETIVEESTIQVPFLANSGSAEGELVTSYDPAAYTIEGRPAALLTP